MLYEEAMESAITVLKNNFDLLAIKKLENKKIAYIKFGTADHTPFLERLREYADVTEIPATDKGDWESRLKSFNLVIIGHHRSNDSPWKGYKLSQKEQGWLQQIGNLRTSNLIFCVFAKPYALSDITSFDKVDAVVMGYQNSALAQEKTAELLFGAFGAKGKLPVSAHSTFPQGMGIATLALKRLGYSLPERVGLSSQGLAKIDRMMQHALDSLMFPGAQVLVARRGKVVYKKSFGKHTYDGDRPVVNTDLYDLASLTKILGTLPMVMKMEEDDKIALNDTFEELVPNYGNTEIKNVTVLKALSHYGRLPAWIPFYIRTLDKDRKPVRIFTGP